MKKHIFLYLYGIIIILVGIFLFFSKNIPFKTTNLIMGITLTVGAILAFMTALSRQKKHVQFAYHEMHALAMLVYGVSVLVFCDTFEKLISFTAFLLIFYSFSELIFCNWLFELKQKVIYKIIIIRLLLGFGIGIGTIVAMNFSDITLEVFGVLFIIVGINIIFYVPIMKKKELNEVPTNLEEY